MGGRVYHPLLRRFLTADPLSSAAPQDLNRYSYALNCPHNIVDPSGLQETESIPEPRGGSTRHITPEFREEVFEFEGGGSGRGGRRRAAHDDETEAESDSGRAEAPSAPAIGAVSPATSRAEPIGVTAGVGGGSAGGGGGGGGGAGDAAGERAMAFWEGVQNRLPDTALGLAVGAAAGAAALAAFGGPALVGAGLVLGAIGASATAAEIWEFGLGVADRVASGAGSPDDFRSMGGASVDAIATVVMFAAGMVGSRGPALSPGDAGAYGALNSVLRRRTGDGLTPHHMPQAGHGYLPYRAGGAMVLPEAEHFLTRSYGTRGRMLLGAERGLPFRTTLGRDMRDIRRLFGSRYDPGLRSLLQYYRTTHPAMIRFRRPPL